MRVAEWQFERSRLKNGLVNVLYCLASPHLSPQMYGLALQQSSGDLLGQILKGVAVVLG